jgi:hypothetical protein
MTNTKEAIKAASELQQSQRPLGAEMRCTNCVYWEPWIFKSKEQHADDVEGECHRRAPVAQHFGVGCIGNTIGSMTWAVEELANVEHDDDTDYEFGIDTMHWAEWPRTHGHEWCGDFLRRTQPLQVAEDQADIAHVGGGGAGGAPLLDDAGTEALRQAGDAPGGDGVEPVIESNLVRVQAGQ